MSNTTKDTLHIAKSANNEEFDRAKRFSGYAILGINKTVNKQIQRDFTTDKEDELKAIANSANADEDDKDLMDALGRWFYNTVFGDILKSIINTEKSICDSYNYFKDTIEKIFKQARECDSKYASKINGNPVKIAETAVDLLNKLNGSFDYYDMNKTNGCTIYDALKNNFETSPETITLKNDLISNNQSKSIRDFVKDGSNIKIFNEYSEKIYIKLGIDDVNTDTSKIGQIIKGHEKSVNKIVNLIIDKLLKKSDDTRKDLLTVIFEDKEIAGLISKLIDATGITAYANGALKIYILKSVKEVISNNYESLFQQIKSGTSNDYSTLKTQYEQLKELELSIIRAYKDMNELDPEQQIQANEWIGEIENQSCGEV